MDFSLPTKRLNLYRNGHLEDVALSMSQSVTTSSLAPVRLWEVHRLKELFLTQGTPNQYWYGFDWRHGASHSSAARKADFISTRRREANQ